MKKKIIIAACLAVLLPSCASAPRRTVYYTPENRGYVSGPSYVTPAPVYATNTASAQQEQNRKILMQGVTGAAVGAISAEASGGKAGTGALVGAGTNVLGNALVGVLTTPAQPQTQYVVPANQGYVTQSPVYTEHKILRRYDAAGNIVSEEEV